MSENNTNDDARLAVIETRWQGLPALSGEVYNEVLYGQILRYDIPYLLARVRELKARVQQVADGANAERDAARAELAALGPVEYEVSHRDFQNDGEWNESTDAHFRECSTQEQYTTRDIRVVEETRP